MITLLPLILVVVAPATPAVAAPAKPITVARTQPLSPDAAGKSFQTQGGFRMELVASEPLVVDPVAVAYDEQGRAYVAEMRDYPYTDKLNRGIKQGYPHDQPHKAPLGAIRLLSDSDGDGRFDGSTVFADGLAWPTGVVCWKGGVFAVGTPDIVYLKDTDGDGKADVRQKVMTGFQQTNSQGVINSPMWGIDHKIYIAGGSNGGDIRLSGTAGSKPLVLGKSDLRFDPVKGTLELESGGARFGNTFDDWGNRFICNLRNPAQHVVLPHRYLQRNPFAAVNSALNDVAEAGDQLPVYRTSPFEAWRELRVRVFQQEIPTASNYARGQANGSIPRSELVAGGFVTSASGVTIYRGTAYPPAFRGNMFVAESANNLIIRLATGADGVTFKAKRVEKNVDFVTSTDTWFRPVNFANAPDGTLHVIDMYREFIEHPCAVPDEIFKSLDFESGTDRGRIWRLAPPGYKPAAIPRLDRADAAGLVKALQNDNAWVRDTAHRLIFERQDHAAAEPLRRLLHGGKPVARLHALWSLDGMGDLTEKDLLAAFADRAPGLRENATRLSEGRLDGSPALAAKVIALAHDPDRRVRLQAAFTLGDLDTPASLAATAGIARRDARDPWVRAAVLSARPGQSDNLLAALITQIKFARTDEGLGWIRALAAVIGGRHKSDRELHLPTLPLETQPGARDIQHALLLGLGEGLAQSRQSLAEVVKKISGMGAQLAKLWTEADKLAIDKAAKPGERARAVELLGYRPFAETRDVLLALLAPGHPSEVQAVTVRVLSNSADPAIADLLVTRWGGFSPALKRDVIEALLARQERVPRLLAAVETGLIQPVEISTARRMALMAFKNVQIAKRAKDLFGADQKARDEIIARYKAAVQAGPGNRKRGHTIYKTLCSPCHRAGHEGSDVGPNLTTVRQWNQEQILVNIIDPNREVTPIFFEYVVELNDGQMVSGIVSDETASGITLKRAGNVRQVIPRHNIARMNSSSVSLMPEGLEAAIPVDQMADLLAFLTGR